MFCYTRDEALKNYPKIILIISNALQAALYLPEATDDLDIIDYFKSLREHLLECLTCIIHCLKDYDQINLFNIYVQNVLNFVNSISQDRYELSLV